MQQLLMQVSGFVVPTLMLVMGLLLWCRPPKKINRYWGYRSRLSMKSQAAWDYAQRRSAVWYLRLFVPQLVLGVVLSAWGGTMATIVIMLLQTILLCAVMLPVEMELKQRFSD